MAPDIILCNVDTSDPILDITKHFGLVPCQVQQSNDGSDKYTDISLFPVQIFIFQYSLVSVELCKLLEMHDFRLLNNRSVLKSTRCFGTWV